MNITLNLAGTQVQLAKFVVMSFRDITVIAVFFRAIVWYTRRLCHEKPVNGCGSIGASWSQAHDSIYPHRDTGMDAGSKGQTALHICIGMDVVHMLVD